MATYFDLAGSCLGTAARSWQSEDADVTDWTIGDDFVFAGAVETPGNKSEGPNTIVLRWRNVTDSGSFAALSGSGELTWSGDTSLVNGNAVASGEAQCSPSSGQSYVEGIEREGANDCSTTLSNGEWTEHQWAINCDNALGNKQYEFELYDDSAATSLGTCAAQITMAAGAQTYNEDCTVAATAAVAPTADATVEGASTIATQAEAGPGAEATAEGASTTGATAAITTAGGLEYSLDTTAGSTMAVADTMDATVEGTETVASTAAIAPTADATAEGAATVASTLAVADNAQAVCECIVE